MTKTDNPSGITRRHFLATTALAGAAVATGATLAPLAEGPEAFAAETETINPARCYTGGCYSCEYDAHIRGGHVVNITPTKDALFGRRPCLRGYAQIQRMYSEGRLKYPLKRKEGTARGAGEWERITWDEAISTIAAHWTEDRATYGSYSIAFAGASGCARFSCLAGTRMAMVMQMTSVDLSVDWALYQGLHWVYGDPSAGIMTRPGNEPADLDFVNAKTIMNWGDNRSEAQAQRWRLMIEAHRQGTKLVTIDPNFTLAAQRSDKWYANRPGTDSALMLGMMNVIVNEGLQDTAYLMSDTIAPYLVRSDTGMLLRMSDLGVEPVAAGYDMYGQPIMQDNPAIWVDGAAVDCSAMLTGAVPEMEGTFTTPDGVEVKTAYTKLVEHLAQYTPERVSAICELSVEDIRELAHLAADGPVTHIMGLGNQAYNNGIHVGTGIGTLMALTGMVGKPGAGFEQTTEGPIYNQLWILPTFTFSNSISALQLPHVIETGTFMGNPYSPIRSLLIRGSGIVGGGVNMNKVLSDVINKIDLVITIDVCMGDSARNSDIVLPAAMHLEIEDIYIAPLTCHLQYADKSVDPAFEAKPDAEITNAIATACGFGDFFQGGNREALEGLLADPRLQMRGITIDALKKNRYMRYQDEAIACADHVYATPTGKVEFYVENPSFRIYDNQIPDPDRVRMTSWEEPLEAWPGTAAASKYPLQLMSERARFRWHSLGWDSDWSREIMPEPTVRMNPDDAAARGIKDGDYVEIYNDRGHAVALANICAGMRPGVLIYPKGWQTPQYKAGNFSELSHSEYEAYAVNSSFFDTQVEMRVWNEGRN